ncbi:P-loop containing nucleoside triphosphate hydrolase protein [Polychytrium aggregatum]|uniref:P-loop containing nucleoside triphosphate hydrolase protein n=1 Tax=Polychytrium aggregatum TaxID=110093 RepID=UPI0022FDC1BF|nr:P-loop containing nucleoside triphosphate hydrolase protein [Polychytrium aggregatum]KAI9203511.1 P-loop containing nucleoside triphosphate hydrolase protein [Polychytrium aggregatum]
MQSTPSPATSVAVYCQCGHRAIRSICQSNARGNAGRAYLICPGIGGKKCRFFAWDDAAPSSNFRPKVAPGQPRSAHIPAAPTTAKDQVGRQHSGAAPLSSFFNNTPSKQGSTAALQLGSNPQQQQQQQPQQLQQKIEVRFYYHSSTHFAAKFKIFDPIVDVFRTIPMAYWSPLDFAWLYPASSHAQLCQQLKALEQSGVLTLSDIPPFVTKSMNMAPPPGSISLEDAAYLVESVLPASLWQRLMPFQRQGVIKAVSKGGRILLGDEMGLGKTIQAISICSYYRSEWPVLIICPSSLRHTWSAEITKWLSVPHDDIQVVLGSKAGIQDDAKFVVISYDLVPKHGAALRDKRFQVVVADESHYLKSREAQRTKAILPLIKQAKRGILLSGTPALSRPIELYTQLSALIKESLGSYIQFGNRYCNGKQNRFGWDFSGSSNLNELNLLLERTVLIRRLKNDVMKELPTKTRQCILVDVNQQSKKTLRKLQDECGQLQSQTDMAATGSKKKWIDQKRSTFLQLYAQTGISKLPAVSEYIQELYENTSKKFLVFGHHRPVLDSIAELLDRLQANYIRIDGQTPQGRRQKLCDEFQQDANCRVGLLGITAAGVGLTLHAADLVVFAELCWNPAQLLQGEDRAHRIGRAGCVDVKYIIGKGTLDDIQWPMIEKKLDVVSRGLDGIKGKNMDAMTTTGKTKRPLSDSQDDLTGADATAAIDDIDDVDDIDDDAIEEILTHSQPKAPPATLKREQSVDWVADFSLKKKPKLMQARFGSDLTVALRASRPDGLAAPRAAVGASDSANTPDTPSSGARAVVEPRSDEALTKSHEAQTRDGQGSQGAPLGVPSLAGLRVASSLHEEAPGTTGGSSQPADASGYDWLIDDDSIDDDALNRAMDDVELFLSQGNERTRHGHD